MRAYVTCTAAPGVYLISVGDERKLIATVRGTREMAEAMAEAAIAHLPQAEQASA